MFAIEAGIVSLTRSSVNCYIYIYPVKGTRGTWNLRVFGALYGVVYKLLAVDVLQREREMRFRFLQTFDLAIDGTRRDGKDERGSIALLVSTRADPAT